MTQERRIAMLNHPTIEAAVNQLFKLSTLEQAKEKIAAIKDNFITSRYQGDGDEPDDAVRLWVKGYDLTDEERDKGFLGHYVHIGPKKIDGKYTLLSQKLDVDLKFHPQKKRPKRRHPDWGHPILRSIKKEVTFDSVDAAQIALLKLHEEYPDVSIPCTNKLYLIIYEKPATKEDKPVQKYVFTVEVSKDSGKFYIAYSANNYKPLVLPGQENRKTLGSDGAATEEAPQEQKGYFANMVELKRSRKAPPPSTGSTDSSGA